MAPAHCLQLPSYLPDHPMSCIYKISNKAVEAYLEEVGIINVQAWAEVLNLWLALQILRLLDNEAIEAEDLSEVQSSVTDYLDRNQEDFDFFSCPDDSYEDVLEQLDNLEVSLFCTDFNEWLMPIRSSAILLILICLS